MPISSPLQCPSRPWADRQWGLCIFDDVVEHCSPSSFKYAEYFLRPMLQSLCDTSPEVRQAAAYGVGVMAQYGGESYRPFCTGTDNSHVLRRHMLQLHVIGPLIFNI